MKQLWRQWDVGDSTQVPSFKLNNFPQMIMTDYKQMGQAAFWATYSTTAENGELRKLGMSIIYKQISERTKKESKAVADAALEEATPMKTLCYRKNGVVFQMKTSTGIANRLRKVGDDFFLNQHTTSYLIRHDCVGATGAIITDARRRNSNRI